MTCPHPTLPGNPATAPRSIQGDSTRQAPLPTTPRSGGNHESAGHGTLHTYRRDRCRCGSCRAANRDAQRRRRRAIAYGQWQPFVDADPIRAHVTQLTAAGLSLRHIAELSSLSRGCLEALMHGKPARGHPPSDHIRATTAARLLVVTAPPEAAPAHTARIDAADARQRLQELIALGWSMSRIAEQLHCTHSRISRLLTRRTITQTTDRQIHDLHRRLSATPPAPTSPREHASIDAARRYAAHRGWSSPHSPAGLSPASQDASIDAVAVQRAVDGHHVALTAAERQAATAQLTEQGTSARQIAHRIGAHPRTVHRYRQTIQQPTGEPRNS